MIGGKIDRVLMGAAVVMLAGGVVCAVALDAALLARQGFADNWPVGFVSFSPLLAIGLALAVAALLGARPGSLAVRVIVVAPSAVLYLVLIGGLVWRLGWGYRILFIVPCIIAAGLGLWRAKWLPAVVVVALVPTMLVTAAVFYGNLTYSHDKSAGYEVGSLDELRAELAACEGMGFPELPDDPGLSEAQFYVTSRRDVWPSKGDSYWLSARQLRLSVHMESEIDEMRFEVKCRDRRRDYGFGFPFKEVEANADVSGVPVELKSGEVGASEHRDEIRGTCGAVFDLGDYQYEITVTYAIPARASEADAEAEREAAEAEAHALAASIVVDAGIGGRARGNG